MLIHVAKPHFKINAYSHAKNYALGLRIGIYYFELAWDIALGFIFIDSNANFNT